MKPAGKPAMRVGIFGAGQAGMMIKNWLAPDCELVCFIDNKIKKLSEKFKVPVITPDEIKNFALDAIIIAVLNRDAVSYIRGQLRDVGFEGEIWDVNYIRDIQDIRLAALRMAAEQIYERNIKGAVAELGVYRGDFAREINRLFHDRKLYLFDTFTGFDERDFKSEDAPANHKMNFADTSVELVKSSLINPSNAFFISGYFPESLKEQPDLPDVYALVSLDADLYKPTKAGLEYFWPRLNSGGMILIHDYSSAQFAGVRQAVDEYCAENNLFIVPLMDLHGTAVLIKQLASPFRGGGR